MSVTRRNNLLKVKRILSFDYWGVGLRFKELGMVLISEARCWGVKWPGYRPQAIVWRRIICSQDSSRAAHLQWQALIWNDAEERTGELRWNVESPEQKAEGLDLILHGNRDSRNILSSEFTC